ncbi:MraY family glycosyltransferase [Pokkaliibacter plantistimulans]|uniref:MraY family glycosyltransferase n=1 Tax=Pokkaliibacter plantistimulans TaxID=1635171 RepID=UPI000D748339|nr:glycosyltransferase family 4 protein [Pokkaliibacter plantistimulans]
MTLALTASSTLFLYFVPFFVSLALTYVIKNRLANARQLDIPNNRSSHRIPTPRGGGLSFVIVYLTGLAIFFGLGAISTSTYIGLSIPLVMVGGIGYLDDKEHVPAKWRLLIHFLSASIAVYILTPLTISGTPSYYCVIFFILCTTYLAWLINLFNFMDGIDGIAASEALTVILAMIIIHISISSYDAIAILIFLAGAISGFLIFNISPAKIFMGDIGSGSLGIMLGGLTFCSFHSSSKIFIAWNIMMAAFITDATLTLLKRLINRERIFEAHNSHMYQRASRYFNSHMRVTFSVCIINLFWLLPVALLFTLNQISAPISILVAYAPLIVSFIYWRN